jgi:hypothetical protein
MNEHVCKYELKSDNLFICKECGSQHQCGADECDFLFYNRDQTQVCGLTGLCFNQRVCETYVDSQKGIQGDDPVYIKKSKRDQQIKNRSLDYGYVMKLLKSINTIVILNDKQLTELCSKILELWQEFVICTKEKNSYTHRKDKRCFVIATAMSLNTGICSNVGQFIVHKHPNIIVNKLNKKSKYATFKVSDIRGGSNLIENVFKNVRINDSKTIKINHI